MFARLGICLTQSNSTGSSVQMYPNENPCTGNEPLCCILPTISTGVTTIFSVDLYDINGKFLSSNDSFIVSANKSFAAGMPVVMDVKEEVIINNGTVTESHASSYDPEKYATKAEADRACQSAFPIKQDFQTGDESKSVKTGVHTVTYYDDDGNRKS